MNSTGELRGGDSIVELLLARIAELEAVNRDYAGTMTRLRRERDLAQSEVARLNRQIEAIGSTLMPG